MLLEGKVAVVTGGTRGIGYSIVTTYLREGAKVALFGSRQETVEAALANVRAELPDAEVMGLAPDLRSAAAVTDALDQVKAAFGSLDIQVNNAGISQSTPLLDYTQDDFDKVLGINVESVLVCSQAAARVMVEEGGGVILNTSSMVGTYGQASGVGYPASKFAVNGITRSLARELGPKHIRVNAVAPGVTATDMVTALPQEWQDKLAASVPLGRIGTPQDVANAFLFLASDMASYVTGAVLPVDGATQV
ncbi:MAG: 3-oxoacyl-ACP reductase FabG [Atopobiaceae bacterium]|jgi:3-oxoacyl-[acyl-carrier protein] reductase/7-alpha-hydroxysteroid dehydrogenase|nr:3-oxoacyl-ACP reductase FabG [Atopobiaceae bacterium]MCH4180799.1 3-oxoacyl-ACP reductase FabG [Atopobiaceae bacterium]MCH4214436.1 3-oxoacyl-ACP reductase FabG [Atopobiaceae bacterium]MCH4229366.1 3-oxoacyl-ACP reductase FabG [Atopobiaceae bacterium]MCH4276676.1 3-oxoacyl-ACP reductase FabG [Atopobiaceae bacterium]